MKLPHSIEAEKAILGSIILDNDLIYEAITKIQDTDFYMFNHKNIFKSIISLYKQNKAIDIIVLMDDMEKQDKVDKSDTSVVLKDILNHTVTSSHFKFYLDILKEKSKLRDLVKLAKDIEQDANNNQSYDDLRFKIDEVLKHDEDVAEIKNINTLKYDVLRYYEERSSKTDIDLLTGIKPLDGIFDGYSKGSLNVIAANTGVGKTTLAINIAENVARDKKNVMVFSLEMDAIDIVHKMISYKTNIPYWKFKKAFMDTKQHGIYTKELELLGDLDINICDKSMLNIHKIVAMIKAEHSKKPLDLVVIDYLQLIKSDNYKQNKSLQIGEITQYLKSIARDLKTHIILISQFSRENSKQDRRPILADLKESSSIEQDADNVVFIHYDSSLNEHKVIVAKNRHGKIGENVINFDGVYSIFK